MLLIGTIGCTIACSVTVVIPVVMIVIGAVHFDDCPAEPYIPVFLIVGGTFLVAKYVIGVAARFRQGRRQLERQQQQQQQQQEMQRVNPCDREAAVGDNWESAAGCSDPVRGATVHVFEEGGGGGVRGGGVGSRRDAERNRRRGRRRNTSNDDDGDQVEEEVDPLQSIISCFLCAWFITG